MSSLIGNALLLIASTIIQVIGKSIITKLFSWLHETNKEIAHASSLSFQNLVDNLRNRIIIPFVVYYSFDLRKYYTSTTPKAVEEQPITLSEAISFEIESPYSTKF